MSDNLRTDFETTVTPVECDVIAPDGSEIRLLSILAGGSMVHCTLNPGETSQAVKHKTVEEIWYFLSGEGKVWRKQGDREDVTDVNKGISLTIPLGTHFQFKNTSNVPLSFIIITMPPWPEDSEEAVRVEDHWT